MSIEALVSVYEMDLTSCEFTLLAHIAEQSITLQDGWLSPNWDKVLASTGFSVEQVNRMLTGLLNDRMVHIRGVQLMPPLSHINTGFLIAIGERPEPLPPKASMQAASPKRKGKAGYVYLMHGIGTEWYKIGRSLSPKDRLKQLDTKSPFEIELLHTIWVDDAEGVERDLHERFSGARVNGEWFALPEDAVIWFCALRKS